MIVNKRGLADMFGVSQETITNWMKAGLPVKLRRSGIQGNEYESGDCIRWYCAREVGRDGDLDLTAERARLAKQQADKIALELAEMRGEMVRYEEISDHWTRRGSAMRQRLLTIPTKTAPRVRAAATDQAAAKIIEAEIFDALEEISGDGVPDSVIARRRRSKSFASTAGATDGQRVGRQVPVPV